jgi:hypothetical protein
MDIEHFQIIVNAMLSWQGEIHPPKKSPSRPAVVAAAAPRDELDDDEDYVDGEEFEPEESLNIEPDAAEAADADVVEAEADADADADLPD